MLVIKPNNEEYIQTTDHKLVRNGGHLTRHPLKQPDCLWGPSPPAPWPRELSGQSPRAVRPAWPGRSTSWLLVSSFLLEDSGSAVETSASLRRCGHPAYLNALLDPEGVPHGLPVLGAGHVEQALVDATLHRVVENFEKLGPDERLGTAQPREKGWLKLCGQLAARQRLIPGTCEEKAH